MKLFFTHWTLQKKSKANKLTDQLLSSPPAEEGALTPAGWRRRIRWLPAAAAADGGGVQALGQGPALAGGPRGLHHSGVRENDSVRFFGAEGSRRGGH